MIKCCHCNHTFKPKRIKEEVLRKHEHHCDGCGRIISTNMYEWR